MTDIIYDKRSGELLVTGHAGSDIVCAGISAICIAVQQRATELHANAQTECENGKYNIKISNAGIREKEALNTAAAGLKYLSKTYPDYINYTEI